MKAKFVSSYFANLKKDFFRNPVYNLIFISLFILSFFSFSFLYNSDNIITGSLVSKDPHKYEHKYKNKVTYEFYADFYFPEKNVTKRVEISEHTYVYAKKGDRYEFSKKYIFPDSTQAILSLFAGINVLFSFLFIILLTLHFINFSNSFFAKNDP